MNIIVAILTFSKSKYGNRHQNLKKAYYCGITFFDIACAYSDSEEKLV